MKSRTSCFNTGIAKNLLRRFWPLWLGYFLILLLVPLVLYSRLRSFDPVNDLNPGLDWVLGNACEPILFLSLVMGVLTAMAMFGFLYSTRTCGLLNSLPVTRTSLFLTACLTGALSLFAADALACGVTALLCLSGYLSIGTVWSFFAVLVFSKAFFYGFAVFCAMLTGSLVILPCVYFLLNFAAIAAELCARDILSKVIFGLQASDLHLVFLSPFVFLVQRIRTVYTYWPSQVQIQGLGFAFVYALVGIALMLLAWRLFMKRQMERSGDTVAIKSLRPVFQYCMCFGSAIVLADVIYSLADPKIGGKNATLVLLALLLCGAFLGYFAARMLIEKSFRVFRTGWKGYIISALIIVLLLGACEFDVFKVEKHVPEAEQVELVLFNGVELREKENIEQVLAYQRDLISHKDKHETRNGPGDEYFVENEESIFISRNCEITYIMKNGTRLSRTYFVRGDSNDILDENSDLRHLEDLENTQEALEYRCTLRYPLTAENIISASFEFLRMDEEGDLYYSGDSLQLTAEELMDFWENGVLPDLAEGHIARRTVCDYDRGWSYVNAQLYLCLVEDREAYMRSGGNIYAQQWINVQIATDSVHCLDWIEARTGVRPSSAESSYANDVYGVG